MAYFVAKEQESWLFVPTISNTASPTVAVVKSTNTATMVESCVGITTTLLAGAFSPVLRELIFVYGSIAII